jgi:hypothetical protein
LRLAIALVFKSSSWASLLGFLFLWFLKLCNFQVKNLGSPGIPVTDHNQW